MAHVPLLTVIIVFHDMAREAPRTLFSLSPQYQGVSADAYDVVAVDHASASPLPSEMVKAFGPNFRLERVETTEASPIAAINRCVEQVESRYVACHIDGARMLSPGILDGMLRAFLAWEDPFVYTIAMHLGSKPQGDAIADGYDQSVEDRLLESVEWRRDGYALFQVSCLAPSSDRGVLEAPSESNCFALRTDTFRDVGAFNSEFRSAGGGLANLEVFRRCATHPRLTPVQLLGEATFHQVHGGVAANAAPAQHPYPIFAREYEQIFGRPYERAAVRPVLFGRIPDAAMRFVML